MLGISGSLRRRSYNSGALRTVASLLPDGVEYATADISGLPFYNTDVEQVGMPDTLVQFRAEIAAADALIFAVPEYNFSISGVLKNALEWLSRPPAPPAHGKPCAVFGASVSPLGTARGQFHFRHVAVSLNLIMVNAPHVDINDARSKFDTQGQLTDQSTLNSMRQLLGELKKLTIQLRSSGVA
jgi:chromate reductase